MVLVFFNMEESIVCDNGVDFSDQEFEFLSTCSINVDYIYVFLWRNALPLINVNCLFSFVAD